MNKNEIIKYFSSTINGSEYITIFDDRIIYERSDLTVTSNAIDEPNVICRIDIKDKFFVDSMILGNLYMPLKSQIVELYNKVNNLNPVDIHRHKNTAKKILLINDNDLNIKIDMYIQEYGDVLNNLIDSIKKIILTQLYK